MSSKVCVIIPVYNAEKTIERCVDSIIYGKNRDVDVILVDDYSADNSWTICKELSKRHMNVRCIQNVENRGVSYTRNQGLRLAESEYILFVDSDDWVSENYVNMLLDMATSNPDALVICGHHFINEMERFRRDYVWKQDSNHVYTIGKECFFDLSRKFLIQQLWNKIFRRDIIVQGRVLFDETQSMGEDFQFVLDYMEALNCQECVIYNLPLYYYIRANNTSLMSNFGLTKHEKEYERYAKLYQLCGEENEVIQEQYNRAIQGIKENFIYQIMHDKKSHKSRKISNIECIMQDGQAKKYYKQQRILLFKENLVQLQNEYLKLLSWIKGRIQREKNNLIIKKARVALKSKDFTIISQNCIGGVFYHDMGMELLSPTINLFFKAEDFVRFVLNLEYYMNLEIEMHWEEEYPVGLLGDISIYFMHYKTCREAKENWQKRVKRINYDRIIVFSTDRESFTDSVFREWTKVQYPKILLTAVKRYAKEEESVLFKEYLEHGSVPDLIPKREFYRNNIIPKVINSSFNE
ncbi:DUF1919 domain-containing protein [Alloiococcus sp. CFN-8]|uniref:DUF1919 domain-containing protein n=1 Tax=Alloiococcus sp. CFN-8 TaxID=3416081 RepID=UPI003CFB1CE1